MEAVDDPQSAVLRDGVRVSNRLVQWASVQAGWYNLCFLTVDRVLVQLAASCSVGTLSLADAAAVDLQLDADVVEDDLVRLQHLQSVG